MNGNLTKLNQVLSQCDSQWILRWLNHNNQNAALQQVWDMLTEFCTAYRGRYNRNIQPFDLYDKDSSTALPFFKTFTAPITTDMRLFVWRMVETDGTIEAIEMDYKRENTFSVKITIEYIDVNAGGVVKTEDFVSTSIWDFHVLKNLGYGMLDDKPIITRYH